MPLKGGAYCTRMGTSTEDDSNGQTPSALAAVRCRMGDSGRLDLAPRVALRVDHLLLAWLPREACQMKVFVPWRRQREIFTMWAGHSDLDQDGCHEALTSLH